ncbi:D-Ala-D-Ala carboxypeptidase family metallohydrolase [Ensifer sp. MJa1]|uniref:D-Ala-D-Ala carboxypeptidase family metallohydrolase n=1 Tax=Ensifer sp. MJa1 TaxID=2919888 RepID=UPI0030085CD6
MQHLDGKGSVLAAITRAAVLSVSLLALSSCVSADAESVLKVDEQAAAQQTVESPQQPAVQDAQVAALGSNPQTQPTAESGTVPAEAGQPLTMQGTGLRAASSSIYGNQSNTQATANGQPQATGNVPIVQPAMNATSNSLFSGGQQQPRPLATPQEGAANEATGAPQDTAVAAYAPSPAQDALPAAVPLPLSAEAAASGQSATAPQAVVNNQAAGEPAGAATTASEGSGDKEAPKTLTLAALFAGKRKDKSQQQETLRAAEKKTITTSNASQAQMASLAYSLPGVKLNTLYTMEHEDHVADDEAASVQVASLSGLARLAPSGLILQTEKVEAGCFKPELMQMLKKVESHYGKQVMVTSGLRPIKVNREKQSLHTRCEAADIQVQGVSKWDLAEFLRSIPGRGGVGTYCHTESVHIDIGAQRDWNWRCRRGKG